MAPLMRVEVHGSGGGKTREEVRELMGGGALHGGTRKWRDDGGNGDRGSEAERADMRAMAGREV